MIDAAQSIADGELERTHRAHYLHSDYDRTRQIGYDADSWARVAVAAILGGKQDEAHLAANVSDILRRAHSERLERNR